MDDLRAKLDQWLNDGWTDSETPLDGYGRAIVEEALSALAARASEEPHRQGCINCGAKDDGGYMTGFEGHPDEGAVGPFCGACWELVGEFFRAAPAGKGSGEMRFVWLMERRLAADSDDIRRVRAGTLVYWDGGHATSFTVDPWKAVQWPTKEAAMERCPPQYYAQWGWQYVEHGFAEAKEIDAASAPPAAQEPLTIDPKDVWILRHQILPNIYGLKYG